MKSYLVEGERMVAVLDTGMGVGNFHRLALSLSSKEPVVLLSHAHFDHIGAAYCYARVLIHPAEADALRAGYPNERMRRLLEPRYLGDIPLPANVDPETVEVPACEPSGYLNEGDAIDLGGRSLEVVHTPGHSPGGITLLDRDAGILFPGDAIYAGPMFSFRDDANPVAYRESLHRIADLANLVDVIYPSHNAVPLTPDDARRMHEAYEDIWHGRLRPDEKQPDRDIFRFDGFSFELAPGRYGSAH